MGIKLALRQVIFTFKYSVMGNYHTNQSCIEACLRCAAVCNHCASSCTREDNIKMMAGCIQLDMECAAICYAAAQLMSLGSSKANEICVICASICDQCAKECGKHNTEHCRECAKTCSRCAEECRNMASARA